MIKKKSKNHLNSFQNPQKSRISSLSAGGAIGVATGGFISGSRVITPDTDVLHGASVMTLNPKV